MAGPENDSFSGCSGATGNGANFVCYFEQQSNAIRQAATADGVTPQVLVGMDASAWGTASAIASSASYLAALPATAHEEVAMWALWDTGGSAGAANWAIDDEPAAVGAWQAAETQNGGGQDSGSSKPATPPEFAPFTGLLPP